MFTLTPSGDLAAYARALAMLPQHLAQFTPSFGTAGDEGSLLNKEGRAVATDLQRAALNEIRDRALFSAAITAEACAGVSRLMVPTWTAQLATLGVVRSSIEASGLVHWLLDPEITPQQRIAKYVGAAAGETDQGRRFINLGMRTPRLRDQLKAVGARSIRPARDMQRALQADGIIALSRPEPGALAGLVERDDAAVDVAQHRDDRGTVYGAFSAAVHGSVAGVNEFTQILLDNDQRVAFFLYLIELTARAHASLVIRVHQYVVGTPSDAFEKCLDRCAQNLGIDPVRLRA